MTKRLLTTLIVFCSVLAFAQKYSVTPFSNTLFCGESFPTSYKTLSTFSINETNVKGFKKGQTKTIKLGLPAGFSFNTGAGSVTYPSGRDITTISHTTYSDRIELTVSTDAGGSGQDALDTIYFKNFEVQATASGSGHLYRGGTVGQGNFKINGSKHKPGDGTPNAAESLGYLAAGSNMVYTSSTVTQTVTDNLPAGESNAQVIGVEVVATGGCSPFNVTQLAFNTDGGNSTGTDNASTNITNADVYFTGTSSEFSTDVLFGSSASPSGTFNVSGTAALTSGTNYFWLVYDLSTTATAGDQIDAQCTSVTMDGGVGAKTPSTTNPTGARTIAAYYTRQNGNWSDASTWSTDYCGGPAASSAPSTSDAVVICDGHTVTLTANTTVDKVILNDGGQITDDGSSRKLTVETTMSINGTGYLNLAGGGELKVKGAATIDGTGTMTVAGKSTYNDDFYLGSGNTYNQTGNKDFKIKGDVTVNGVLNIQGNKKLKLEGNTTQYIDGSGEITSNNSATTFQLKKSNKVFQASSSLTIEPKVNFNENNYTVVNYGSITLKYDGVSGQGDLDASTSNNSWTNASGSELIYEGQNNIFATGGTLYASATDNTVNYAGSGSQNIIQPSGNTYYNVEVSNTGTKTIAGTLDVNGDVLISGAAVLATGNNSFTVGGNWENTSSAADPFTEGTSTVTFDGASDQSFNTLSTLDETFNNITVSKSSGDLLLTSGTDVTINGTLTLTTGDISVGSSYLIIGSSASISGGSDGSLIRTEGVGALRKMWSSPGSFTYPVGDDGSLTEFDLTITVASFAGSAYTDMNVTAGKYNEVGSTGNYINRYWDLSVTGITTPVYNFTCHYLDGDVVGTESECKAQKWDGDWQEFDAANTSVNTLTGTGATSFSKFGGFDELVTLPVELISFDAELIDKTVYLEWETGAEINNSHFEVLHSTNGMQFYKIGEVEGAGNSTTLNTYQYWHEQPHSGTNYYQLKQVDFDGKYTFSEVKAVDVQAPFKFIAFPNPNDGFKIKLRTNENYLQNYHVKVLDMNGKVVFNRFYNEQAPDIYFTERLESGLYFVNVSWGESFFTQKLTVR